MLQYKRSAKIFLPIQDGSVFDTKSHDKFARYTKSTIKKTAVQLTRFFRYNHGCPVKVI